MDLLLGNKIKELRKARGITQEQLADAIGVSFQAISKWETGIALPDITLVPALASYFGITTDALFNFNLHEMQQKVEDICDEAYKFRESDAKKSRAILEDGLRQYPDNDILLNNLLYVMNYSEKPDETIAVASKLIEQTEQSDVKYDALRFLAYAYNAKGDIESAKAAIEKIPEIYFTKLSELAFLLSGEEKRMAAEKQKGISFEILLQMMCKISECCEADGNKAEAIAETECALKLLNAMFERAPANDYYNNYVEYFNKQLERMKNQ